ncbi:2'-5' RNA ligase family protein [Tumebacillus flagellatus]|uniref:2'-5' RNA ligase n=1 Tax=Tumebacillus flagellatus TaxID=1157490 RepID=A0A074LFZ2_9BACL|nr:2'-5' RNA ligase family protein [Tumebacillus flagellatus]KEO81121.1 hypothetical protein EL26_22545 [Tumebacillus flagellatus]
MVQYFLGVVPPPEYQAVLKSFHDHSPVSTRPFLPHITVKAQPGLTPDLAWLEKINAVCADTEPFNVQLGEPDMFGDRVLFVRVQRSKSPGLYAFHDRLLDAVNPDPEVSAAYFEPSDVWHAHLTLAVLGDNLTAEDLLDMKKHAAVELSPFPSFPVEFLRVYRWSGEPGTWYEGLLDIPLGELRS